MFRETYMVTFWSLRSLPLCRHGTKGSGTGKERKGRDHKVEESNDNNISGPRPLREKRNGLAESPSYAKLGLIVKF